MANEILRDLAEIIDREEHLYLLERPVATPHALLPSALEEHSQKLLGLATAKEKQGGLIVLEYTPPAEKSVQLLLLLLHSRLRHENKRARLLLALTGSTIDELGEEVSEEPLYLLIHQAPRMANFVEFLEHQPPGTRWVVIATGLDRTWQRLLPQLRLSYTPYALNGLRQPQELKREIEQILNEELSRQTQAPNTVQEIYRTVALSDAFGVPLPLSLLAKALGKDEDAIAELVDTAKGLLYWVEREKPPALLVSTKGEGIAARVLEDLIAAGKELDILHNYQKILQAVDPQDREERHTALKLLRAMLVEAGRRRWTKQLLEESQNLEGVWKAGSAPELLGWGKLFEELQLFESSERVFRYGLRQNLNNVYLLHAYARMLGRRVEAWPKLQTELHQQAAQLFEELLRLPEGRKNIWVWQSWADMEAKVGDPREADSLFQRAYEEDPKSVYVLVAYADFLRKHHRYTEAEEQLNKALAITEKEKRQDIHKVYTLQILGEIARQRGLYSEAEQRFAEALQTAPKNVPTLHTRAMMYKERGWLAQALKDLNEALRGDEGNPYTLHALAEVYTEQGHYPEAQQCFEEVLKLQPSNFKALIAYATMQRKRGEFQLAEELLRRAENPAPQSPYLWHARGEMELARGNSKRAQEFFEYVVERLDPSNIATWTMLGQLEAARDLGRARRHFRHALEIAERQEFIDRIKTRNAWAVAESEHGDPQQAQQLYAEALKLDGENVYTLGAYARLLHKLEQAEEAQKLEERAKELQKKA